MSGELRATVTLDQEQYRRLNASEAQLRAIRQDLPEILRRAQDEAVRESQARFQSLEERNRQFAVSFDNLQGEARRFQQETAQRLEAQQTEFAHSFETVRGEVKHLASETAQRFGAQRREFDGKMQQQRHEIDQELHRIESRVGDLETRELRKMELARAWLQAAQGAHDSIAGNPRHEQFAPGKLAAQADKLRTASQTLKDDPSAALVRTQDATQALAELMLELQQKEQEWVMWRSAALGTARALDALLDRSTQVEVLDMQGQPSGESADTEFWTKGKLTPLKEKLKDAIARIESETPPLQTSELQRLVEEELPALDTQIDALIEEARSEMLSAQLRFDMAEIMAEEVKAQMFVCEGGTYEGRDMRAAYVTKLMHRDGGEITIRVAPVEGKVGVNSLHIHSYDVEQLEPEELEARQNEILEAIAAQGLEVSKDECIRNPDQSVRDLRSVEAKPSSIEQKLPGRTGQKRS